MKQLTKLLTIFLIGICFTVEAQRMLYLDNVSIDTRSATTREADFLFDKYGKFEPSGQPSEIQIGTIEEGEKVAMIMTKSAFENMTPSSIMMWALGNFEQHLKPGQGTRFGIISNLKYHAPGDYTIYPWQTEYILYAGSWTNTGQNSNCECAYHNHAGAYLEFPFNGTGVEVISEKLHTHGKSEIWLDGELMETVDLYDSTAQENLSIFKVSGLESKQHVIKIRVTGHKNDLATNTYFVLKRFEVTNQSYRATASAETGTFVSNHSEYHKAVEKSLQISGKSNITRKGYYQVYKNEDGTITIFQPEIRVE